MSINKFLDSWASAVSENKTIAAIRRGLMFNIPLTLIGSMCVLIRFIPIKEVHEILDFLFKDNWNALLLNIQLGTFEIMSICALICISYALAIESDALKKEDIPPIIVVLVVMASFFMLNFQFEEGIIISMKKAAATGLFSSVVFSVITTKLFLFFSQRRIFQTYLQMDNSEIVLTQSLRALEPAILLFLIVGIFKIIISKFPSGQYDLSYMFLFIKNQSGILVSILYNIFSQALWFLGLHGTNILESVARDVFVSSSEINSALAAANEAPVEIFTKQFLDIFVYLGGSGSSLCLIIAWLFRGKKLNSRRLARFSLVPGIFNINELVIYGFPVMLNPYMLIPFICVPIALTCTTALAMALQIIPLTTNIDVTWSAPLLWGGYEATGSILGAVMQLVNLAIGTLIYVPFVDLYEKHKIQENQKVLKTLTNEVFHVNSETIPVILNRNDLIGSLARSISRDIYAALNKGKNELYLEFQPQVNYDGKVTGAEALLRWEHALYGKIPPPVIVTIAEEAGFADDLGNWIIKEALSEYARWKNESIGDFVLSINLSSEQIKNPTLIHVINKVIAEYNLDPCGLEFELTESAAIGQSDDTKKLLENIREKGSQLAIDDFGMGHSSLMYIKEYHVDTIKLDGSLVHDLIYDSNSLEIVSSICKLCNHLGLKVIAEYVETNEQREKLHELGCDNYQGYYYSKSLPYDDFVNYVRKTGVAESKHE